MVKQCLFNNYSQIFISLNSVLFLFLLLVVLLLLVVGIFNHKTNFFLNTLHIYIYILTLLRVYLTIYGHTPIWLFTVFCSILYFNVCKAVLNSLELKSVSNRLSNKRKLSSQSLHYPTPDHHAHILPTAQNTM